jgi:hypothetical protein
MGDSFQKSPIFEALKIDLEKELSITLQNFSFNKINRKNKYLYHYTNLNGLKGIIENQSFFSSNSAYLNDTKEYYYGIELFKNAVKIIKEKAKDKKEENVIEAIEIELENKLISYHYVTCFSLESDLLSQWRAYADDGKGIAIGFDLKTLVQSFEPKATGMYIEYNDITQQQAVENILDTVIKFYLSKLSMLESLNEPNLYSKIACEINEIFDKYVGQFKHNSFKEEREYRFDLLIDNDINKSRELSYRVSKNNLLVPYLELKTNYQDEIDFRTKIQSLEDISSLDKKLRLKIKKLPVKEIILGPSIDYKLNKKSIGDFLKKNGYTDEIEIKKSNVPYRI